jgi:hypothetical protein
MANDAAADAANTTDATDNLKLEDEPDNARLLEGILDFDEEDEEYMQE